MLLSPCVRKAPCIERSVLAPTIRYKSTNIHTFTFNMLSFPYPFARQHAKQHYDATKPYRYTSRCNHSNFVGRTFQHVLRKLLRFTSGKERDIFLRKFVGAILGRQVRPIYHSAGARGPKPETRPESAHHVVQRLLWQTLGRTCFCWSFQAFLVWHICHQYLYQLSH